MTATLKVFDMVRETFCIRPGWVPSAARSAGLIGSVDVCNTPRYAEADHCLGVCVGDWHQSVRVAIHRPANSRDLRPLVPSHDTVDADQHRGTGPDTLRHSLVATAMAPHP